MVHCETNRRGLIYLCIGFAFTIPLGFIPFYYANVFFDPEIPLWEFPEFPPIIIIEIPLFCGFIFFVWWGFRIICLPWGLARKGEWKRIGQSDVHVIHGAVLKTGKVLMFAGKDENENYPLNSAVWDPETGNSVIQEENQSGTYRHDLFCSHHSFLANGKLLVNGGDNHPNGHTLKVSYEFDPETKTWTQLADMKNARWYPTTLTLPESEGVITFSGDGSEDKVEVYDLNDWEEIPNLDKTLKIYPGMHLMPDGKIFYSGTRWAGSGSWVPSNNEQTALFDKNAATNKWTNIGHHIIRDRTEGMSVILPPDNNRVLVIGGKGDDSATNTSSSTNSVEMIDFNDDDPQWSEVAPMHYKRRNVNAVILPTGKVLVCAGVERYKFDDDPKPVLTAELYDPDTNVWRDMATMSIPRLYHSVSLLLPDARVLNVGSIKTGVANKNEIELEMEVYSPPYLFCGNSLIKTRPSIKKIPEVMHHGQTYTLETPDAKCIRQVVLVRPGAVTHHTDTEQRVIPVRSITVSSTELRITMPSGSHPNYEAIRGYYMIFIINKRGVPSKAEFIELH